MRHGVHTCRSVGIVFGNNRPSRPRRRFVDNATVVKIVPSTQFIFCQKTYKSIGAHNVYQVILNSFIKIRPHAHILNTRLFIRIIVKFGITEGPLGCAKFHYDGSIFGFSGQKHQKSRNLQTLSAHRGCAISLFTRFM